MRYLREAKAELSAAQKFPYMAPSLILEAVKKAQAAVYYSLGEPGLVEAIVHQTILEKQVVDEPVLRCLVDIERTVQKVAFVPDGEREKALEEASDLIKMVTDIVQLFAGERVD